MVCDKGLVGWLVGWLVEQYAHAIEVTTLQNW